MNITLTLPFPPSTNRMWRHFNGRTVLSKEAVAFYQYVVCIAAPKAIRCTSKPVAVTMTMYFASRAGDVDNRIKPTLDSLIGTVYEDDKQVQELHVYRRLDRDNPRVEVEVCELAEPAQANRKPRR